MELQHLLHKRTGPLLSGTAKRALGLAGAAAVVLMLVFMPIPAPSADHFLNVGVARANSLTTGVLPGGTTCSIGSFDLCISALVYWIAVAVPSFFVTIAAFFFSIAVKISLSSASYALTFLASGWTISRDMANMLFLFILVYLAFTIMLEAHTNQTLQTLGLVIVIALLVNFSFFATRIVIDAGNIVGTQIYNAIPISSGSGSTGSASDSELASLGARDLAADIMNAINVDNLLETKSFQKWNQQAAGAGFSSVRFITLTVLYLMIGLISITLALAFVAAGVNFVGRTVVLWFCIMFAPFAWVAAAVPRPAVRRFFNRWLETLLKHTVYPAVFLFGFLFIVLFVRAWGSGTTGGVIQAAFGSLAGHTSNGGFLYSIIIPAESVFLPLFIVVLMLKHVLGFADKLGLESAEHAKRARDFIKKRVTDPYTGWLGGFTYRSTAGWAGHKAGELLGRTKFGHTAAGQVLRQDVLQPIAKKSFGPAASYLEARDLARQREEGRRAVDRKNAVKDLDEVTRGEQDAKDYAEYSDLHVRGAQGILLRPEQQARYADLQKRFGNLSVSEKQKLAHTNKIANEGAKNAEERKQADALARFQELERQAALTRQEKAEYAALRPQVEKLTPAERQRLEQIAPGKALTEEESRLKTRLDDQRKRLKGIVEKADEKTFETMSASQIQSMAYLLNKAQMDKIDKMNKFTLKERGDIMKEWGKRGTIDKPYAGGFGSPDNPLNQFDKAAKELHETAKKMGVSIDLQLKGAKNIEEMFKREHEKVEAARDELQSKRAKTNNERNASRLTVANLEKRIAGTTTQTEKDRLTGQKKEAEEREKKLDAKLTRIDAALRGHRDVMSKMDKADKERGAIQQHQDPDTKKEYAKGDARMRPEYETPTAQRNIDDEPDTGGPASTPGRGSGGPSGPASGGPGARGTGPSGPRSSGPTNGTSGGGGIMNSNPHAGSSTGGGGSQQRRPTGTGNPAGSLEPPTIDFEKSQDDTWRMR